MAAFGGVDLLVNNAGIEKQVPLLETSLEGWEATAEIRGLRARQLVEVCARLCGMEEHRLKVEFTQHSGDEMFHPHLGGFNKDWRPGDGDEIA